jgi:pimeloyl-ACP methyl ester carboxylesterase
MADFARRTLKINGIETVFLTAGVGPPLVYLHGAGTVTRFDFAHEWTRNFQVFLPYHPGFGESADDPEITEIHDYVLHYLELFEALKLSRIRLVGHSMGGFIATKLAIEHAGLLDKLALVCPIGIPIPEHPSFDFLKAGPEQLPALLAADPTVVTRHLPRGTPDAAFLAERAKEVATAARVLGAGLFDRKLPRYLHRLTMPTLLVWGKQDRMTPAAQQAAWAKLLPHATVRLFENAGHVVLDEAPESVTAIAEFFAR